MESLNLGKKAAGFGEDGGGTARRNFSHHRLLLHRRSGMWWAQVVPFFSIGGASSPAYRTASWCGASVWWSCQMHIRQRRQLAQILSTHNLAFLFKYYHINYVFRQAKTFYKLEHSFCLDKMLGDDSRSQRAFSSQFLLHWKPRRARVTSWVR